MSDEELADRILAEVGVLAPSDQADVEDFLAAGEAEVAATFALIHAHDGGIPVSKSLVNEAVSRWPGTMGDKLPEWFAEIPDRYPTAA